MYIDYSKVIAKDLNLYINIDELNELKSIAKKERECFERKHGIKILKEFISKKAIETVYINARHKHRSNVEKAIIANNIVFDDQEFAEILQKGNFNLDILKTFLKLVNYLKTKIDNDNLTDKDKEYLTKADKFARKLVKHFSVFMGDANQNIIINKINEIISFNPELLDTKTNKHTR